MSREEPDVREQRRTAEDDGTGLSRRRFLGGAVATALASGAWASGARAQETPPAGRHLPRSAIGLQFFTIREPLAADFEGTWAKVAAIGYANVELGPNLFGRTVSQIRALMDELGLKVVSRQMPLEAIRTGMDAILGDARVLGQRYIRCPSIPPAQRTVEGYRRAAADFNAAGEAARNAGFQFGYHNHGFDFDTVDGAVLMDVLLAETDPLLVDLQLDVGWATAAGVDVVEFMTANPRRVGTFHVKDVNADGVQVDPGDGIVDFAAIFDVAVRQGVREYIVEHDNPADPLATARAGHEYLTQLTF
jgi:sugar phosphate isomerase/epimerase